MISLDPFFPAEDATPLAGKVALITGASAGIGLATAVALAAEGVNLRLVARRAERLATVAEQLRARYPSVRIDVHAGDLRDDAFFTRLDGHEAFACDILVNNAGLARGLDPVAKAKLSDWRDMLSTNVEAAFHIVHACLPHLIARGGGHIVCLGSVAGHTAYENGSVYCATKHALGAFCKALRQETCDKNIRVSVVSPGMVNTEFSLVRFAGDQARADAVYQGMAPLTARDIARQIVFCLKEPAHVNVDEILVMPRVQGAATKVHRAN